MEHKPAAPSECHRHRERERTFYDGKPDHAQQHRVHLGVERLSNIPFNPSHLTLAELVGVNGACSFNGLGDCARQRRVTHALSSVARGGVAKVVAGRDDQKRYRDERRDARQRADEQHGDEGKECLDEGDEPFGQGKANRTRQRFDVIGGSTQ